MAQDSECVILFLIIFGFLLFLVLSLGLFFILLFRLLRLGLVLKINIAELNRSGNNLKKVHICFAFTTVKSYGVAVEGYLWKCIGLRKYVQVRTLSAIMLFSQNTFIFFPELSENSVLCLKCLFSSLLLGL